MVTFGNVLITCVVGTWLLEMWLETNNKRLL